MAKKLEGTKHFRDFLSESVEASSRKAMAISRLGSPYRPEASSILRDQTEVLMDMCWVCSYFDEDQKIAEKLSAQFFQGAAAAFIPQEADAWDAVKGDIFLRDLHTEETWRSQDLRGVGSDHSGNQKGSRLTCPIAERVFQFRRGCGGDAREQIQCEYQDRHEAPRKGPFLVAPDTKMPRTVSRARPKINRAAAYRNSMLMSRAVAEWVREPTEM
ncbi:TPA: hypothetical protein DCE37_20990 [Candidatus Latescibacteria bacterium]|nr:hypothetical protein [Candidatus Latescibacterota bacterium]|tara:strand:+ start:122 stop:766 length:645 start_codon:yes stop_codon:yes gene_type:complete